MQGRARAKAEERREAVLKCRPPLPEGWEGVYAFYLRLNAWRRPGPAGPAPVTLEDLRALLDLTGESPAAVDEMLDVIPMLEARYFEIRAKKIETAPPPAAPRQRG